MKMKTKLIFFSIVPSTQLMEKMKAILNTVPQDKDSIMEKIFCTNNEHALIILYNKLHLNWNL